MPWVQQAPHPGGLKGRENLDGLSRLLPQKSLATFQAAKICGLCSQGIGLRPQPRAGISRPFGPQRPQGGKSLTRKEKSLSGRQGCRHSQESCVATRPCIAVACNTRRYKSTQRHQGPDSGKIFPQEAAGGTASLVAQAESLSAPTLEPERQASARAGTPAVVSAPTGAVRRRSAGRFATPGDLTNPHNASRCNTRRPKSSFAGLFATTREPVGTTGDLVSTTREPVGTTGDLVSTSREAIGTSREAGATRGDLVGTPGEASSRCAGPGGTTRELAS